MSSRRARPVAGTTCCACCPSAARSAAERSRAEGSVLDQLVGVAGQAGVAPSFDVGLDVLAALGVPVGRGDVDAVHGPPLRLVAAAAVAADHRVAPNGLWPRALRTTPG